MHRSGPARWLASLLAAAALATCASACDSGGSGSAKATSIVYWATQQSGSLATDRSVLNAELARFTDQTGIRVRLEIPTWDVLYAKILTAVTARRGPDVLNIGNTWSAALQSTGAFVPFDDAQMSQLGGAGRFLPSSLASTGAAGRPPASVPLYGQAYALFYNRKMFAAAGIHRPPATWDELLADAKKLTHGSRWGVAMTGANGGTNAHLAFILGRQEGAHLFDNAGHPHVDSAAEVRAVKRLIDLMDKNKVVDPGAAELSAIDAQTAFAKGKAAMIPAQAGARVYFRSLGFTDYAVAPMPTLQPLPSGGADVRSIAGGTNLSVPTFGRHRTAAMKLVRFLTSDAEQVRLNAAYHSLPVVRAAYSNAAFNDPGTRTFGSVLAKNAEPMPMVAREATMETLLGSAISALWGRAAHGPVTEAAIRSALHNVNERLGRSR